MVACLTVDELVAAFVAGIEAVGADVEGAGLFAAGLAAGFNPSIALNASLLLPFALLVDASASTASSPFASGEALRAAPSLILKGASLSADISDSSTTFAAFLASASLFLSASTSSSFRFGAGSIPNSECLDDEALPSFGFLVSAGFSLLSGRSPSSLKD